jgi:transcriptional regulator NrdR family protein
MPQQTERKKWPAENSGAGLECRKCGCRHFFVDNTRRAGRMIIRYRRCRNCGQRMTTCERALGQSG